MMQPGNTISPNGGEQPDQKSNTAIETKKRSWKSIFHAEMLLPPSLRRKLGRHARLVGWLVVIIAIGVGVLAWEVLGNKKTSEPVENFQAAVAPFKVISTLPYKDQSNVDTSTTIKIDFNRPVDPTKAQGDFFVSPSVQGTFSRGNTDNEIVFKPNVSFAQGTKVQVMLHGEFQSKDGSHLGADFFYGFTTSTPGDGVLFEHKGLYETLSSAPASQAQSYTLVVGDQVGENAQLNVYKSDMDTLLRSLTYGDQQSNGITFQDFIFKTVDDNGLTPISTKQNIKNNDNFSVPADAGVYLVVAKDKNGKQVGHLWVVYSDFGVLLRQDDQKVVLTAQRFSDNSTVDADVQFYSLKDSVKSLAQKSVSDLTSINLPYSPKLDAVVAKSGNSQAIVPVSELTSQADLRVNKNLAATNTIFGLTDKPSYKPGESVRFAGFAKSDNDAQYSSPAAKTLNMYVAESPDSGHLTDFSLPVKSDGSFSGSVTVENSFIPSGKNKDQLHIYANNNSQPQFDADIASFTATSEAAADSTIKVSFGKTEYLSNDKVVASIDASTKSGDPLANETVNVNLYSKQYYENDASSNLNSFDTLGDLITDNPVQLKLDAQGHGSFTVDVSKLPAGASRVVTVQADRKDSSGLDVAGGGSAIVHQGDGFLEFGSTRTVVQASGKLTARVYVKKLDHSPVANTVINYKLVSNYYSQTASQDLLSGTATTDSNGFAEVNVNVPSNASGSLVLVAWFGDANNNKVQGESYYYLDDKNGSVVYSDLQLAGLDVSGSSTEVKVGDKLHLTINSPAAVEAMVTLERGRVYQPQMLKLNKGNNSFDIDVTPELAPSFTLVLAYFNDGGYQTDGVQFDVDSPAKQLTMKLSPDNQTYKADSAATISLSLKDKDGAGVSANTIVGIVDANMYRLYNQVVPDIYNYLYSPREITTNSSSSLTVLGSGGGKCGGGGGEMPDFASPVGSVLLWQPQLHTDSSGNVSVSAKLPIGNWRVYAYSMNGDTAVGSSSIDITAQ